MKYFFTLILLIIMSLANLFGTDIIYFVFRCLVTSPIQIMKAFIEVTQQ